MNSEQELSNQLNAITGILVNSNIDQGLPPTSDATRLEASLILDVIDHNRPYPDFVARFGRLYNASPIDPSTVNLERFLLGLYPRGEHVVLFKGYNGELFRLGDDPAVLGNYDAFDPSRTYIDPSLTGIRAVESNARHYYLVLKMPRYPGGAFIQSLVDGAHAPRAVLAQSRGALTVLYDYKDPDYTNRIYIDINNLIDESGQQIKAPDENGNEDNVTQCPSYLPNAKLVYFNPKFR